MSFPTITGAGQTHTLANGVTYVVTPNLAWRIQSFPTNISLLSEFTLPGSGFVGDLVPRPRLYIDDTANPDVLMTLDSATNTYTPGGGLLKSQLDALNATASGATYPTAAGVPASYVDDTVSPAVLKLWDGSGFVDAGGGADNLGGTITPASVDVVSGVAFSETFTSSSGVVPFTWSLSSGSLPAGLTLDSNAGTLTGTPSAAPGTAFNFTLRATDTNGDYNENAYSGNVVGTDLGGTITPAPAAVTFTGSVPVSETFASSNGTAPFTWSIAAGSLPTGVSLNATTGVLSGTPTDADGTAYSFTVRAVDGNGDYNDQVYSGNLGSAIGGGSVSPPSIIIAEGQAVSATVSGAGGTAPYEFHIIAGALPAGLSFNATTGALSGTPSGSTGDPYSFTIRAVDATGAYVDKVYSGSISAPVGLGPADPTSLSQVGTVSLALGSAPTGAVFEGNYAYVISRTGNNMAVVDVSDPASMTIVGTVSGGMAGTASHQTAKIGNYIYFGNVVVDVSDPTNPSVLGYATVLSDRCVATDGTYLYTGGDSVAMEVYDISADPVNPTLVATASNGALFDDPTGMTIKDGIAVAVSDDNNVFLTYDVSDPTNPLSIDGSLPASADAIRRSAIQGNHAYMPLDAVNQVRIFDISDPSSPSLAALISQSANAGVWVSGDWLYLGSGQIPIYNISDPANPVQAGSDAITGGNISEMSLHNGTLFAMFSNSVITTWQ